MHATASVSSISKARTSMTRPRVERSPKQLRGDDIAPERDLSRELQLPAPPKPRVVIGAVGDLIREGLRVWCEPYWDVHVLDAAGRKLMRQAQARGAVAVVAAPSDIDAMAGELPEELLVLGISSRTTAVMVCWGPERVTFTSAHPSKIVDLVRSWSVRNENRSVVPT
jgi:hypothetical protein